MAKFQDLVRQVPVHGIEFPSWLERLASIGIVSKDPQVVRRQRFTNIACLATAANALSHFVITGLYDFRALAILHVYNLLIVVVALSLPGLHRYGKNVVAIFLCSITIAGNLFVVVALGLASDLHIYFTLAGAMLFLFGVEQWRLFLVFFIISTTALLLCLKYAPVDGLLLPTDGHLRDLMSSHAMVNAITINALLIFYALTSLRRAETELELQYERSEALVSAVLPTSIAARLTTGAEGHIADRIGNLSVLFADLVGFTAASHELPPYQVVAYLNDLVHGFEDLCEKFGVEKIKSIGDGLMAVAGLQSDPRKGAIAVGELALAMIAHNDARPPLGDHKLGVRVGLHCGEAIAGVIGGTRFSYDVWGDAVNMAARLEQTGERNRVQVSEEFRALAGDAFEYEERGETALKGIGETKTHFLVRMRSPPV